MKMNKIAILGATVLAGAVYAGALKSGLASGERITPFHPQHATGALADSTKCFPCTFKDRPQAIVWVNNDSMENVLGLAKALDKAQTSYASTEFKSLVVFLAPTAEHGKWTAKLKDVAKKEGLNNVSMAVIDPSDKAISQYKINTDANVKNTVLFYKNWQVVSNWVNVKADEAGMNAVKGALKTVNGK